MTQKEKILRAILKLDERLISNLEAELRDLRLQKVMSYTKEAKLILYV